MGRYQNGYVPTSVLVRIASGTNKDGYWEHLLTPSQKHKHDALVARAKARNGGRTLRITNGYNAYRPYFAQVIAKRKYGSGAAAPGYSSHGGTYKGDDAMAMDYGNWYWVYNGDKAAFYADCRAVGLAPGVISYEPWHVIDYDPWAVVPAPAGDGDDTPAPRPSEIEEEETMNSGVYYKANNNGKGTYVYLIFNAQSGWYHQFGNGDGAGPMPSDYNNSLARSLGTPSWAEVTSGHAAVIRTALEAVQRNKVSGNLTVTMSE